MAFIVEDGTGKDDATSYLSVAGADTYHTEHGNPSAWSSATDAVKEGALMQATRYLDGNFSWRGTILVSDQALGWPRTGAVDDEGRDIDDASVPMGVEEATALLALYHLSTPLDASFSRGDQIRRQKVGSVEVEYDNYARPGTWMPFVRTVLKGMYVGGAANQVTLQRA